MTDRVRTLVVTLDRDIRDDDVESIVSAIKMTRCVTHVETGPVVDLADHTARTVVFRAIKKHLWDTLLSWEADKSFDFTKE